MAWNFRGLPVQAGKVGSQPAQKSQRQLPIGQLRGWFDQFQDLRRKRFSLCSKPPLGVALFGSSVREEVLPQQTLPPPFERAD